MSGFGSGRDKGILARFPTAAFLVPVLLVLLGAGLIVAVPRGIALLDSLAPEVQLLVLALCGASVASGTLAAVTKLRLGDLIAQAHKHAVTAWVGAGSFAEAIIAQTRSTIRDAKLQQQLSRSVIGIVGWTCGESELAGQRVQLRSWGFPGVAVLTKAGKRSMFGAIQAGKGDLQLWRSTVRGFLRGKRVSLQLYFVGFGLSALSRAFTWHFVKERVGEVCLWWLMRTPEAPSQDHGDEARLASLGLVPEVSGHAEGYNAREQALLAKLEQTAEPSEDTESHRNGVTANGQGKPAQAGDDDLVFAVDQTLLEQQATEEEQKLADLPDGDAALGEQKEPVLALVLEEALEHGHTFILGDSADNTQWREQAETLSLAAVQVVDGWDSATDSRPAGSVQRVDARFFKKVPNIWVASEVVTLTGAVGINPFVESLQHGDLAWSLRSFNKPKLPWAKRQLVICVISGEAEAISEAASQLHGSLPGCTVKIIAHAVKGAKESRVFCLAPIARSELVNSCFGNVVGGLLPPAPLKTAHTLTNNSTPAMKGANR